MSVPLSPGLPDQEVLRWLSDLQSDHEFAHPSTSSDLFSDPDHPLSSGPAGFYLLSVPLMIPVVLQDQATSFFYLIPIRVESLFLPELHLFQYLVCFP